MFDFDSTIRGLEDFPEMREGKRLKFLRRLFFDDTFIEWLFQPPKNNMDVVSQINDLYVHFAKPKVIRSIIDMIMDEGPSKFTRSHATFVYSICNIAIANNNDRVLTVKKQKSNEEITSREAREINEKIEKYNLLISELLKVARKIIKRDAKILSRESYLPKYVCITAYHSVPEPKYVDRFKIGYYLNNLLNSVYSDIDNLGGFMSDVKWRPFFKAIFGKENIIEVATFILLEGVHRIDKYKNSDDVKKCWDSLTAFALKELNDAPDTIRSQMIELYIKRIDKMFSNRTFDLRVNLLTLSDDTFPKLAKTVTSYAERIEDILSRGNK